MNTSLPSRETRFRTSSSDNNLYFVTEIIPRREKNLRDCGEKSNRFKEFRSKIDFPYRNYYYEGTYKFSKLRRVIFENRDPLDSDKSEAYIRVSGYGIELKLNFNSVRGGWSYT